MRQQQQALRAGFMAPDAGQQGLEIGLIELLVKDHRAFVKPA